MYTYCPWLKLGIKDITFFGTEEHLNKRKIKGFKEITLKDGCDQYPLTKSNEFTYSVLITFLVSLRVLIT